MNWRRGGWLLLVGIGGLAAAELVAADVIISPRPPDTQKQSHIPIPPGAVGPDAERLLRERLGRAKDLHGVRQLLEKIIRNPEQYFSEKDLEDFKQLGRSMQANPGPAPGSVDPQLLDLLQRWVREQKRLPEGEAKVPPQELETLERGVEELKRLHPNHRPTDITKPGSSPPPPPRSSPPGSSPPPSAEPKDIQSGRGMLDFLNFARRYMGQDSAALRRAETDLRRQRLRQAEEWLGLGKTGEGLRAQLPERVRSLPLGRWLKEGEGLFRTRKNATDLGYGGGYRGPPTSSGGGSPSPVTASAGSGAGFQVLFWLFLGLAVVFALWKVLAGQRERRAQAARGWKLGPWPVDPAAVGTREELVRAFEYLTLLCLGPAARCWNHRRIADRLGGGAGPERRSAAAELTELYEQARYAPPEEPLPAGELEAARRHLCLLAGGSTA
jgi:hypothetical protein